VISAVARLTAGRVHYAWVVLMVVFVATLAVVGVRAAPGVMINPLQRAFGWDVSTISGAIAINIILLGATGPFLTGMIQTFGLKRTQLCTMAVLLAGTGLSYSEPDDVAELPDGEPLTVAGLEITVDHAPGHTRGSVLFRLPGGPEVAKLVGLPDVAGVCLSGDVLFAGSIGRTDLPGGSMPTMMVSLRRKVLPLDDATLVLPGHGPATTIGRERQTNPYLRAVAESPAGKIPR